MFLVELVSDPVDSTRFSFRVLRAAASYVEWLSFTQASGENRGYNKAFFFERFRYRKESTINCLTNPTHPIFTQYS